ncbi:MAG: hypothetical protein D6E12_14790, partial [Desulfovibrio sp.]
MDAEYLMALKILLLSQVSLFVLAAAGSPAMATVSEILGRARKKVFLDKAAWHIATLGVILALATLPFTVGSWVLLYLKDTSDPLV